MFLAVADPDLEIGVWGWGVVGRSFRPLDKGGAGLPKKILPLWASVWSKNKGEGSGPLGPSPGSTTVWNVITRSQLKLHNIMIYSYWERKDWLNSEDSIIYVDNIDFGSSKGG